MDGTLNGMVFFGRNNKNRSSEHSENYFIRILYAACMIELIMNFATSIA